MDVDRIFAIALCATTAACSTLRSPSLPEARCHAAGAAAELGKPLDDHTKQLALLGAGAARSQVVPYGAQLRNRDVDPQRLNIEVDGQGTIQRLQCG
jgi:hypothetical protein